jgi:hypothetical protein
LGIAVNDEGHCLAPATQATSVSYLISSMIGEKLTRCACV